MAASTSSSSAIRTQLRALELPRDLWASWGAFCLGLVVLGGVLVAELL